MGLYLCPCRADCDLFGRFDRQQYPAENRYAHRQVVPDNTAVYAKDFRPKACWENPTCRLGAMSISRKAERGRGVSECG